MSGSSPLAHLKVLDLSKLLPGPMTTLYLAGLGADVIRIDGPDGDSLAEPLEPILNRNKRTIPLDLRQPAGRDAFLRLARDADVVVEGFRPGVVDRLGVGYSAVSDVNPRVVYCSISGYGQNGPDCLRAGHDINYLAASGVGDQIGADGGPPALPNLQVGDLLGGSLTAAMGILAAVLDVQAGGTGRHIDVSITDSLIAHSFVAHSTGAAERGAGLLSGGLPCYRYYRTLDGRYLAVGALERKFWDRLCDVLDRPDLKSGHFASGESATRVRDELSAIFGQRALAHWERVFQDADCCVTPVRTLEEAIAARGAQFGAPFRMSGLAFSDGSIAWKQAERYKKVEPSPGVGWHGEGKIMSSSTVNQPMEQQAATALGQTAAPAVNVLHKIWLAGLGVVAVAGKQTGRIVNALVEEGKQLEPNLVRGGKSAAEGVGHAVSGLGAQLKKVPDAVRIKESGEAAVKSALGKMGLPTKEELDALARKIDALNARLDAMRAGGEKPEPGF